MKRLGHILFTAVFVLACLVPGLGMIFTGPSQAAANEILAPPPRALRPDGSLNWELLGDAADYFSDHFAFRQELVTADSRMKSSLFHTSSQPDVALGQEGWLFFQETLDVYTGANSITPRQAFCIARSLALAQDSVKERGAQFVFTIAPNKISLYPQFAPAGLEPAPLPSREWVVEALTEQGVEYVDLFAPLSQQEEVLYHRLDSHWTNRGAALGHDLLLEGLGLAGNAFEKEGEYQNCHRGDLHEMLYPASQELDRQFVFSQPLNFSYTRPIRDADDLRIQTESPSANGPLLMFRDSFGNALHSLMAESFSSALFSRATPYNLGLMDQISAQYVVLELVERNLSQLARGPFLLPAPRREAVPEAGDFPAPVQAEAEPAENLPGFQKLSGTVDAVCDEESPIYLLLDGGQYEAFPVADGPDSRVAFAAYLPEDADWSGLEVLFLQGGQWLRAALASAG